MIISLIGFMAAGKTTLGRKLAQQLGAPFIDTDAYIEEKEDRTIREIFTDKGEDYFRELEEKYLEDILEDHISQHSETLEDTTNCSLVLSLGGGMVTRRACVELVDKFTYCVYLKVEPEILFKRLSVDSASRPMLGGAQGKELMETIEKLFRQREPLYLALAKKIIPMKG